MDIGIIVVYFDIRLNFLSILYAPLIISKPSMSFYYIEIAKASKKLYF